MRRGHAGLEAIDERRGLPRTQLRFDPASHVALDARVRNPSPVASAPSLARPQAPFSQSVLDLAGVAGDRVGLITTSPRFSTGWGLLSPAHASRHTPNSLSGGGVHAAARKGNSRRTWIPGGKVSIPVPTADLDQAKTYGRAR